MEKYNKGEFIPGDFVAPVCDRTLSTELNVDFILPDYQPEIRRLLRVGVTLTPPSHYIGASGAEFSGTAHFDVLYAGSDGQLYTTRLSEEYGFEAPFDDVPDADTADGVAALADIAPDTFVGRVIAPRKLGIRCRLKPRVRCYAKCRRQEKITGLDDVASLRRLTETGSYAVISHGCEESVAMGDEIIPEQREGEIRVIGADGSVFISESAAVADGVSCRGDLILKIMICREGGSGEPEIIVRKLPFSHEIPVAGAIPGCECRAWGDCGSVSVTVGDGRLSCDAAMSLQAETQCAADFEYTSDIYSTSAQSETVMTERTLQIPLRAMNGNFTQNGVADVSESGIPAAASIIDADGTASLGGAVCEKGRCVMTGDVRYNILYEDSGEYGSRELSLPFRYEFDLPAGDVDASAVFNVSGCRARMDGERIAVDSEIAAAVRLCSQRGYRMVDEVRFSGVVEKRRGECVVCYPDKDDTLWSVAKRYHSDAEHMAAVNSIRVQGAPDAVVSLGGAKFVII